MVETFLIDRLNLSEDNTVFRNMNPFLKTKVAKESFSDYPVYKIWKFYKLLVQFGFIVSKTEFDIQCKKGRASSWVAERLKN